MKKNKGFTLMELLIVIAIIVILVAIAIPVFSNQLEKARETTDAENIRAAMSEIKSEYVSSGKACQVKVPLTQSKTDHLGAWDYVYEISGYKTAFLPEGKTKAGEIVNNPIQRNASGFLWVRADDNGELCFSNQTNPKSSNWLYKKNNKNIER